MINQTFTDTRHYAYVDFALNNKDVSALYASLDAMRDRINEDAENSAQIQHFKIRGAHHPDSEEVEIRFVITTNRAMTAQEVKDEIFPSMILFHDGHIVGYAMSYAFLTDAEVISQREVA